MVYKILAGAFVALMAGAVVYGAVALARGDDEHSPQALGAQTARNGMVTTPRGGGRGAGGVGRGLRSTTAGQAQQAEALPLDWETVEGVAVALDDLVIALDDGSTLQVGLGPAEYREAAGFVIEIGQRLAISGYREGDEFKAGTVTSLETGASIVLRSDSGRPMWAGQGKGKNRI